MKFISALLCFPQISLHGSSMCIILILLNPTTFFLFTWQLAFIYFV